MSSLYKAWKPKPSEQWQRRNTRLLWSPDGKRKFPRHAFIPDFQCKRKVRIDHAHAAGVYLAMKKPDVIVLAGDMGDFPSCSFWDRAKWEFGEQRYDHDMNALEHILQVFLAPILDESERTGWMPRIIVTLGNHEDRVDRALEKADMAKWIGAIEMPTALYERYGIEVFPFLEPVLIDGIAYCHYFPNPMTGKPLGGMMATMLKNVGFSFSMGHVQMLDNGNRSLANGQVHRGLKAGAFYMHDEDYKGRQGNLHWRGIYMKNEVDGFGNYSGMDIEMAYLLREHGPKKAITAYDPDPKWTGIEGRWEPTA
jgi:hypothetical protein